jgi:L-lactate dehydrogenase complex protein LldG
VAEQAPLMDARAEILERVAAATATAAAQPVTRGYRRAGAASPAERAGRFCERVREYRADVRRVAAASVRAAIDEVVGAQRARRLVVPAGLPSAWRPAAAELVEDAPLTPRELDALDGVVTGCTVAIAETGTIVLTAAADEGRRALTLVPDLHVCVVEEERIVELVPEALARLAPLAGVERRPVTFVSGPSATSDIELRRVEGVHGPRRLCVLVVSPEVR